MFEIDWSAAWLQGFKVQGQAVMQAWQQRGKLCVALNQCAKAWGLALDPCAWASDAVHTHAPGEVSGVPIFVPQAQLPVGEAYESFIYNTHCVPTRENLHDFFNALCWFRFPKTKSYLNAEQAQTIERDGLLTARGSLRDALTLLDENACFVWCEDPVWHSLQAHHWMDAFWHQRAMWSQVRVELFGHALLEKLCTPYKAITAHAPQRCTCVARGLGCAVGCGDAQHFKVAQLEPKALSGLARFGGAGMVQRQRGKKVLRRCGCFSARKVWAQTQLRRSVARGARGPELKPCLAQRLGVPAAPGWPRPRPP